MPRLPRNRLSPWIERLILSYGSQEEQQEEVGSRLKAHVIGVGQMSQSQAGNTEGPTGLLFLSDGVLQIPAVLTASAWEHLQEQEDRECFSSLLNSTVCIQDYRLQFHMASEQTKCRFFLSVGELATTAAGPVKDNTPCCTTLSSVRMKICKTWRALLGQEDSQKSQCEFDLSQLLGEWQHDCLQAVLEDVREKLTRGRAASLQPSTSTCHSTQTCSSTRWDVDRIRYKGEKCFSVPVKYLLIPEEDSQQVQTLKNAESSTERMEEENILQVCNPPETTQPSVDATHWQIVQPAAVQGVCASSDSSSLPMEDSLLHEDVITGGTDEPLSNPWNIFSPPCISSSSSDPDPATSTQLPAHLVESSYFPPYQKQLTALPTTATSSFKRKQSESTPEALDTSTLAEDKEAELSSSPPSWLFDTSVGGSSAEDGSSPKRASGSVPRKIPKVHRDGRPFSYSYRVCGQNLQDFSRFRMTESLLHWAVKYLVTPKQTDNPANVA
uniref:Uncharacterized LOC101478306 n=1 Tax=Maylandia zebra TaxID=106582 RepID=A0A3P9CH67_9CICH